MHMLDVQHDVRITCCRVSSSQFHSLWQVYVIQRQSDLST